MTAAEVIALLHLVSLPGEGGYYRETYRSGHNGDFAGYVGPRAAGTAIYYLLTPDQHSRLHLLPGDEVYHFYLGDPVELLLLHGDGRGEVIVLGPDLRAGQVVQALVPGGTWQGSRLRPGGAWALLGTTMSPGFEFADFCAGDVTALARTYRKFAEMIVALQ